MMHVLPFTPNHSLKWLERYFKKDYYKKPYDRFMWWRSYTPKNKPLTARHSLKERILNGDFNYAPYGFEAEIVEHRMNNKLISLNYEEDQWHHAVSVDRARRKRLLEDFDKEEVKRLEELKRSFILVFKITSTQYDKEVINFRGKDLISFYEKIENKYGTYWKPMKKLKS